jgi:hypothetical protein
MFEDRDPAVPEGAWNPVGIDEPPRLEPFVGGQARYEVEEAIVFERKERQLLLPVDSGKNSCREGAETSPGREEHHGPRERRFLRH